MAANAYIQTAVAELNNVLNDLMAQIRALEADAQIQKLKLQQEEQVLDQRRKLCEAQKLQMRTDSERHNMEVQAKQLEHECTQLENQINQVDTDTQREIQRKNQAYNQLRDFVSQLSSKFSSSDFS